MTTTDAISSYDQAFGRASRRLREEMGWSMTEFAGILSEAGLSNFHATTVSRVESGARAVRLAEAIVIAETLGLSLDAVSSLPEDDGPLQYVSENARRPVVRKSRRAASAPAPLRVVTIGEVAERYRVSEMHIRRLVDRGVIHPCAHLGRALRFDLAEVDEAFRPSPKGTN